jgi:hypothetical protein
MIDDGDENDKDRNKRNKQHNKNSIQIHMTMMIHNGRHLKTTTIIANTAIVPVSGER